MLPSWIGLLLHGPLVGQVYTVDLDMKFPDSFVSFVAYGIPVSWIFFGRIRFTKGVVLFTFLFDRDVYTMQITLAIGQQACSKDGHF